MTETDQYESHCINGRKTLNDEAVSGEVCLRQFEVLTFSVIIDSLLSGLDKQVDAWKGMNVTLVFKGGQQASNCL